MIGNVLMIIITACYVGVAVDWFVRGSRLMAGVVLCYAVANALLLVIAYQGNK